ncbi:MAG TPA: Rrf2 family transcriptional regulator [Nitrospiria bacterium]
MLKLSKKIDYGLIAISHIAYQGDDKITNAKRIAEEYQIPRELLAKILQKLARQGLIDSQNGPKGGYSLTRSPDEITVGEVVKAIEGPVGLVDCHRIDGMGCQQIGTCTVRLPIQRIQDSISRLLEEVTIEQINRTS